MVPTAPDALWKPQHYPESLAALPDVHPTPNITVVESTWNPAIDTAGGSWKQQKTETQGGWQLKKESSDFLAGVGQIIHGKRFLIHSQSPNAQPGGLLFCQKGRMTFRERFSFLNSGRFLKTYGCELLFPQLLDST